MVPEADYDAVVVGAGAGGAAAAWRMTRRGWRVLLVDAGPRYDPANDYALARTDWERTGFPAKPGSLGDTAFAPMQALGPEADDLRSWSLGQGRTNRDGRRIASGPGYHHVRGIGGSTLHFVGESHRLHPKAFALRTRFGVGADWPLDYAALEPYYLEVERFLGVAGPAQTGERWRSAPYPLPPHRLCLASRLLGTGARALGIDWDANPRCALSQPYDGRPPCNYCGGCTFGCPRGDKGSADVTFVAKALASGLCTVASDTMLARIDTDGPRATAVVLVGADGQAQRIRTRRLVLACGAIETPRLLLLQGLANASGQVGRNLLESVGWTSVGQADVALHSYGGLPSDAISWHYNAPDAIPGHIGGFRINAAIHESELIGPVAHAQRAVPGFGHAHKAAMRKAVGSLVAVGTVAESLPNESTRVELDDARRDALGRPLARIASFVDDATLARLRVMATTARALLRASGVTRLVEEYGTLDYFSSAHVFGTCRMGSDPATSVVDDGLRVHGYDNFHLCDASVFPSSGGGEAPTLTLQALALRAVDAMA